MDLVSLCVLLAALMAAGMVQGVIGFGLGPMAIALFIFAPEMGHADLVGLPCLAASLLQWLDGGGWARTARRFGPMAAGIIVGILAGFSEPQVQFTWMEPAGGILLMICGVAASMNPGLPPLPRHYETFLSPIIGLVSGALTGGGTGLALPALALLQFLGLTRKELIQALGFVSMIAMIAYGAAHTSDALRGSRTLILSGALVLPTLAGMWLGRTVRAELDDATFRLWSLAGLVFVGTSMV